MSPFEKPLGRPKGSKTKAKTPGRKRAREFIDLVFESGRQTTECAKIVGDKNSVSTEQIFKDAKRHEQSIAKDAWEEAMEAEQRYEAMRLALEMGPHQPTNARYIVFHTMRESLKGNMLP